MAPIGASTPDSPRQIGRTRLPLPPVPPGPRTSAAPFRAVPNPELPGGRAGDGLLEHSSGRAGNSAAPVIPRSARIWDDEPALVSTGPGLTAGSLSSGPAPHIPRQTSGQSSPAYGDWTKPSRAGDPFDDDASGPIGTLRVRPAPETSLIPERPPNRRERATAHDPAPDLTDEMADVDLDSGAFEAPLSEEQPLTGHHTGPVGGRAARRAERQAIDEVRRKAEKRSGTPDPVAVLDEDEAPRRPRRVLMGLVAMTVVALGVLGVYSVVSPETQEASSGATAAQSTAPSSPAETAALPPLEEPEVAVETAPATPVKAPVTVLNATDINGMAADVAGALNAAGWETPGIGGYTNGDVAASTVFFTEGDETQRQAALALVDQFPQLTGPAPRFFELPADVTAPGIVVVLAAPWQP